MYQQDEAILLAIRQTEFQETLSPKASPHPDKLHDEELMKQYFGVLGSLPELYAHYVKVMKEKKYKSSIEYFKKEVGGLRYHGQELNDES